ncbi:hypothetical protein LSH36_356g03052 [Paralvinella palmiformis]|uniref:Cytosol aminopeptidase domain-containing protein n=1 Tax=Paralvinella palmiformis TaxID=53620 RepID=A0AAD9JEE1_9ANNE|nr:hypothetical protein LSH36_356g03052 [Paralvinella palmiformis]
MAAPLSIVRPIAVKAFSFRPHTVWLRTFGSTSWMMKGLVLGVYKGEKDGEFSLTKATQSFQESRANKLSELIQISGLNQKGKERVFHGLDTEYTSVAVVSLGKKDSGFNELEELDEARESVRAGVAAAAEGSHLCVYVYDELKTDEKKKVKVDLHCYTEAASDPESIKSAWSRGTTLAEGQLLAKYMMEAPANVMTPTKFAEVASEKLGKLDKVKVYIRDKAWAEEKKMGSFLSVTKGSSEPPKFVDNTDAEGRLILADGLVYAQTFKPRGIVDVATLTGGMIVALGSSAAGVFSNSTPFWEKIHKAGITTGDRVWRMPLFQHYSKQVTKCHLADLNNISSAGRWGSPCTAAAFLREFVTNDNWMHVDIAGVAALMGCKSSTPYMSPTVTARLTVRFQDFGILPGKEQFITDDAPDTCAIFNNGECVAHPRHSQFRIRDNDSIISFASVTPIGTNLGCWHNLYMMSISEAEAEKWTDRWTVCRLTESSMFVDKERCSYVCRYSETCTEIQLTFCYSMKADCDNSYYEHFAKEFEAPWWHCDDTFIALTGHYGESGYIRSGIGIRWTDP